MRISSSEPIVDAADERQPDNHFRGSWWRSCAAAGRHGVTDETRVNQAVAYARELGLEES
jgi:hypothetical protein